MSYKMSKGPAVCGGGPLGNAAHDQAISTRVSTQKIASTQELNPSPRDRRDAEAIHNLGPLPLAYFIAEVRAGASIDEAIRRYAGLPAAFIAAYGADRDRTSFLSIEGGHP